MGSLIWGVFEITIGLVAYATGWLFFRLSGRRVESLPAWWSRRWSESVNTRPRKPGGKEIRRSETSGQDLVMAEQVWQVGCLVWLCLAVILPAGMWLLYSLTV